MLAFAEYHAEDLKVRKDAELKKLLLQAAPGVCHISPTVFFSAHTQTHTLHTLFLVCRLSEYLTSDLLSHSTFLISQIIQSFISDLLGAAVIFKHQSCSVKNRAGWGFVQASLLQCPGGRSGGVQGERTGRIKRTYYKYF